MIGFDNLRMYDKLEEPRWTTNGQWQSTQMDSGRIKWIVEGPQMDGGRTMYGLWQCPNG